MTFYIADADDDDGDDEQNEEGPAPKKVLSRQAPSKKKSASEQIIEYLREKDKSNQELRHEELALERQQFEAQTQERQGMHALMNTIMNRMQK